MAETNEDSDYMVNETSDQVTNVFSAMELSKSEVGDNPHMIPKAEFLKALGEIPKVPASLPMSPTLAPKVQIVTTTSQTKDPASLRDALKDIASTVTAKDGEVKPEIPGKAVEVAPLARLPPEQDLPTYVKKTQILPEHNLVPQASLKDQPLVTSGHVVTEELLSQVAKEGIVQASKKAETSTGIPQASVVPQVQLVAQSPMAALQAEEPKFVPQLAHAAPVPNLEKIVASFRPNRYHKFLDASYRNPQKLSPDIIKGLERTPAVLTDLYRYPWQSRWHVLQQLGSGAFGVTFLVQNIGDKTLAVMKKVQTNKDEVGAQPIFATWGDYVRNKARIDATGELTEFWISLLALKDEASWAAKLQEYGRAKHFVSRFLFMQCLETNFVEAGMGGHQPLPDHELYAIVNFGGKPLNEVHFNSKEAMTNLLGELSTALNYLGMAGIVHHDLKGPNIMYSENFSSSGRSAGGHVVVIDFGSLVSSNPTETTREVFLDAAFTPGYGPYAYELHNNRAAPYMVQPPPSRIVTPNPIGFDGFGQPIYDQMVWGQYERAKMQEQLQHDMHEAEQRREREEDLPYHSFDVFSMAGVFSEVLLGENLIHRFFRTPAPGQLYNIDWVGFNNFVKGTNGDRDPATVENFKNEVASVALKKSRNGGLDANRFEVFRGIINDYPDFLRHWMGMWSPVSAIRVRAADQMLQMFADGKSYYY